MNTINPNQIRMSFVQTGSGSIPQDELNKIAKEYYDILQDWAKREKINPEELDMSLEEFTDELRLETEAALDLEEQAKQRMNPFNHASQTAVI